VKFGDYSPPSSPSLDQQRDALQKGLGRAMQWALNGCLDDEPLMEACLGDQRFDMQVEDSRGNWLWRMIQAVGATARFRVPILHVFRHTDDVPAVFLHVRQQLPVMVIGRSGELSQWSFFLGHVKNTGRSLSFLSHASFL
jgi:hypothetical protein